MSYSSKFNQDWLKVPQFSGWIMKHESPFKAYCKLCCKAIELSNMGKRALTSHADSKGHKRAASSRHTSTKMEQFVKTEKECSVESKEESSTTETLTIPLPPDAPSSSHSSQQEGPGTSQQLLQTYLKGESVLKAEVLWAMKSVLSHFSFRASADIGGVFQNMFPDSAIAKKFTYGKTKMNYLIFVGIGPYFREKLLQKIKK